MQVADLQRDTHFLSLIGLNRLALAVSGGSDSMAMLRMVRDWAPRNTQIIALTVDHDLRAEAKLEAAQVAAWCAGLGIPHHILKWQHPEIKTGIQAKARKARYDLMAAWCAEHDVQALLTAHTADDQAETVAMRAARTNSAAALAGIWAETEWQGLRVIRPLLNHRRQDLRNYLTGIGQGWIDDPSNEDVKFERVRVRQGLNGELSGLEAQAQATQTSIKANSKTVQTWCLNHFQIHETGFLTISLSQLKVLGCDILDLVLRRMIDLAGSSTRKPDREERGDFLNWINGPSAGRRTLGGALFVKREEIFVVGREAGRIANVPEVVPASGFVVWDGRFRVEAPPGATVVAVGVLQGIERRTDIPAFVQASLPAVLKNGAVLAIPHLGIGSGVRVKFLRT